MDSQYVSYSANFEDVILRRLFLGMDHGFYVDVGAGHPVFESDTKLLYDSGWHGANIEPNPAFFKELEVQRPRDRNFCVALGDQAQTVIFYEIAETGLSTCHRTFAEQARGNGRKVIDRKIQMTTLAQILDEMGSVSIDLLKIDVEGLEEEVLAGNDWQKFRPSVIVVEATYPESPKRRHTGIRADLESRGYCWQYFDGLNDFYVRKDFNIPDGTFDRPPNVFDRFTLRAVVDAEKACEYALSLKAELDKMSRYTHSLEVESERLRNKLQDETFERVTLEKAVGNMRHEMVQFSREIESAARSSEELAHVRSVLAQAGAAKTSLEQQLAQDRSILSELETAKRSLADQLLHVRGKLEEARSALAQALDAKASTEDRLQHVRGDLQAARSALAQALDDKASTEHRLNQALSQYHAMLQSTSWALTAPLRAVVQMFK